MAFLHFYTGKTLEHVRDLSSDLINISITASLNGSLGGSITIEETSANATFLKSLKENSHFIKVGLDKAYGCVVESATKNKNIWTVEVCGALEYFDKIDAIPSHKAGLTTISADDNDYSNIKVLYSDSPLGILYEVLRNNSSSMTARGFSSSLINYSSLLGSISSSASTSWSRSYRINGLETPSLKSILDDLVEDSSMPLLAITTSQNFTNNFAFVFEVIDEASAHLLDEAVDSVFEVAEDISFGGSRSYAIARGTDLKGRSRLERVNFSSSGAYSSLTVSLPQEKSGAIRRRAIDAAASEAASEGILTFSSFEDNINLLDFVELSSAAMPVKRGMVVEKAIEGQKITYTLQLGGEASFGAVLKKPLDGLRKIIFKPLNETSSLSLKNASRKSNSTGWRS